MTQRFRLAVVMDPIGDIKYAKDTTLAMLLSAHSRYSRRIVQVAP